MANQHYAEIGDVWKHLPLAEVLAIERPDRYWETHAGSALYPLTPSPTRDYGVYRVLARASQAQTIDQSTYLHVLRQHASKSPLARHPGSARIAMSVRGRQGVDPRQTPIWAGEITVAGFGAHPLPWNPGVSGCGIACANLSRRTTAVCEDLGNALQMIYAGTQLPTGDDGSLSFWSLTYR